MLGKRLVSYFLSLNDVHLQRWDTKTFLLGGEEMFRLTTYADDYDRVSVIYDSMIYFELQNEKAERTIRAAFAKNQYFSTKALKTIKNAFVEKESFLTQCYSTGKINCTIRPLT